MINAGLEKPETASCGVISPPSSILTNKSMAVLSTGNTSKAKRKTDAAMIRKSRIMSVKIINPENFGCHHFRNAQLWVKKNMSYYDQILESSQYLLNRVGYKPEIAIVLGTGLGSFTEKIQVEHKISYNDIPHFPQATVKGHEGALIFGKLRGKNVVAQSGRYHYYEGYNMKSVTLPIRVFHFLGVKALFIASATGGIHEDYKAGDITVVNDHINLHHENPLQGPNDERLGPRFPDMSEAYSRRLIDLAQNIAKEKNIQLHNSVYAGLPGPNLETKAEYNYLNLIGATVVGMSTVPEVIVAKHMELETCVFAVVTNKCFPISAIREVTHDEVIEIAQSAERKISKIVEEMITRI